MSSEVNAWQDLVTKMLLDISDHVGTTFNPNLSILNSKAILDQWQELVQKVLVPPEPEHQLPSCPKAVTMKELLTDHYTLGK